MLAWLKNNFKTRYGVEPMFILDRTWFDVDSTITTAHAEGKHGWTGSKKNGIYYTYESYNNDLWGCLVPAFRGSKTLPGCGSECREILRRDGEALDDALSDGLNSKFIIMEGWTDMIESAGFYRSNDWNYPNQYINITRRYSDPEPETLKFQAEGADRFYDKTGSNEGGKYADRALDVGLLNDNTGWYVGWTEPGEWIQYDNVELGCGTYRFTARVASARPGGTIRLDLSGLQSVTIPNTDDMNAYELVHLGEVQLARGTYDLKIIFESGGVNLDWFFLKRSAGCR